MEKVISYVQPEGNLLLLVSITRILYFRWIFDRFIVFTNFLSIKSCGVYVL